MCEPLTLFDAEKDMLREHFSERSRWGHADGLMWCINPPPAETYAVRFVDREGSIDVSFTFPLQIAAFPLPNGTAMRVSSARGGSDRWRDFLTRHSAIPGYASRFPSAEAWMAPPASAIPVPIEPEAEPASSR